MEYSGQQVMAYLMGWGDTLHSHTYTPIYWSSVTQKHKCVYPELRIHEGMGESNTPEKTEVGHIGCLPHD